MGNQHLSICQYSKERPQPEVTAGVKRARTSASSHNLRDPRQESGFHDPYYSALRSSSKKRASG